MLYLQPLLAITKHLDRIRCCCYRKPLSSSSEFGGHFITEGSFHCVPRTCLIRGTSSESFQSFSLSIGNPINFTKPTLICIASKLTFRPLVPSLVWCFHLQLLEIAFVSLSSSSHLSRGHVPPHPEWSEGKMQFSYSPIIYAALYLFQGILRPKSLCPCCFL